MVTAWMGAIPQGPVNWQLNILNTEFLAGPHCTPALRPDEIADANRFRLIAQTDFHSGFFAVCVNRHPNAIRLVDYTHDVSRFHPRTSSGLTFGIVGNGIQ